MKKLFLPISFTVLMNAVMSLNCFSQDLTCSYTLSGQNNTCHGSNDAGIWATIPSNVYPSLYHSVYWNGNFVSNVSLGPLAGTTFFSPVYFDNYGVGTWEYFSYYDDGVNGFVQCDYHKIVVIDPGCTYNAAISITNSSGNCANGKIKVSLTATFSAYPHLQLYDGTNSLVADTILAAGTANYSFTGLKSGHYTVKTFDATCCEKDLAAPVKCPKPVSGFSATNVSATSAKINWTTVSCASAYKIQYRKEGSTAWISKSTTGNVGNKVFTGLSPSTDYEWKVSSKCTNAIPLIFSSYSAIQHFTTAALKLGEESVLSSSQEKDFKISLTPNPASGFLYVSFDGVFVTAQVKIINGTGQVFLLKTIEGGTGNYEFALDVSMLPKGIYVITIQTGNEISQQKFVKE